MVEVASEYRPRKCDSAVLALHGRAGMGQCCAWFGGCPTNDNVRKVQPRCSPCLFLLQCFSLLISLCILNFNPFHVAVKMEAFVIDVAPPLPRLNVTATTDDLRQSPQLYYAVRRSSPILLVRILGGRLAKTIMRRVPISCGCSCRRH